MTNPAVKLYAPRQLLMNTQDNPYSAPDSTFSDPPRPPVSALKAILAGLAIDIGGAFLINTIFTVFYGAYLAANGKNTAQIGEIMANLSPYDGFSLLCMVAGSCTSVIGGFVCSRMSRRADYKLGIIMGCISAIFGLLMSYARFSIMANILLTLMTFACVMAGAHFGRVRATSE